MHQFTMTIHADAADPVAVPCDTRDLVKFERATGREYSGSLVDMYEVTRYAAIRTGKVPADMTPDQFEATYAVDSPTPSEEEPDPTRPAPSTGQPSR